MRDKLLPVLACAVLLSGCAGLGPRLETPKLSIVSVELIKGDLFEQRLRARMRVQNPNDRDLAVKGLTYTIEVGGEEFGRGMSGSSFTVPRMGEAEFDMNVTANLAGTRAARTRAECRIPSITALPARFPLQQACCVRFRSKRRVR
jgi:LEA14-like dessication related protein